MRLTGSEKTGHIEITNSIWGHLNASPGFEISVSNCYYSESRTTTIPLIDATFCNITIRNSLFSVHGVAVLRVVFSHIQIQNTTLVTGDSYEVALPVILVKSQSKLRMESCSIINHARLNVVQVEGSSEAKVFNCTFFGKQGTDVRKKSAFNTLQEQSCLLNSQNGSGTMEVQTPELPTVFLVVGSHLLVSWCYFISGLNACFGYDYSELMIIESTFDSSPIFLCLIIQKSISIAAYFYD